MKKCENPNIEIYTKTHKKRTFNLSDIHLPEGIVKKCVWCLGPLTGRQLRWCGSDCSDAATEWALPQQWGLRSLLVKQNFKCNICAFDWGIITEHLYAQPKIPYGMSQCKDVWRTNPSHWLAIRIKDYMHFSDKPHRLEVDHIVPIFKGGLPLDLANLQCICYDCHKTKTKVDMSGKRSK